MNFLFLKLFQLLQRKPGNRLGLNGAQELKQHVWMRDFDWNGLLEKRIDAPYKPQQQVDNFDKVQANNDAGWKNDDELQLKQNA